MAVTGVQKWPCPTCTYNNWSSSIKCVLCGCSRPNEITSRASVVKYRTPVQGWSKLAHSQGSSGACLTTDIICADFNLPQSSLNTVDVQPHHHHKVSGHGGKCKTKGKWTCASCTFTNWPNTGQCTMCGAPRSRGGLRHDPIISAGGRRDPSRSPHLSESILNYASGVGGAVGGAACHAGSLDEKAAPSSSQDAVFIQPVAAKSKQNSRNGKRTSSHQQADNINNVKKWKCHQCTYENWPRAVKCIMCQSPHRRTPSPPLSGGEEQRDTIPRGGGGAGQFPPASATSQQQAMSRLTSLATTRSSPSSSSNSSSPVHSRSSSNSNETLAVSQRVSPDVSNGSPKEAGSVGGGGGSGGGCGSSSRLIAAYERENWSSLEIMPSSQLKSDSDEVRLLI